MGSQLGENEGVMEAMLSEARDGDGEIPAALKEQIVIEHGPLMVEAGMLAE